MIYEFPLFWGLRPDLDYELTIFNGPTKKFWDGPSEEAAKSYHILLFLSDKITTNIHDWILQSLMKVSSKSAKHW